VLLQNCLSIHRIIVGDLSVRKRQRMRDVPLRRMPSLQLCRRQSIKSSSLGPELAAPRGLRTRGRTWGNCVASLLNGWSNYHRNV